VASFRHRSPVRAPSFGLKSVHLGPDVLTCLGLDQLRGGADAVARFTLRRVVEEQQLGFVATVGCDGTPNDR
jgi:hypothetical protein